VYQRLTDRLRETLAAHILKQYGLELAIVLERPPKIEMGEAASPVCFELAKQLKRAPRQIAQEIANGLGRIDGIARVAVAGGRARRQRRPDFRPRTFTGQSLVCR